MRTKMKNPLVQLAVKANKALLYAPIHSSTLKMKVRLEPEKNRTVTFETMMSQFAPYRQSWEFSLDMGHADFTIKDDETGGEWRSWHYSPAGNTNSEYRHYLAFTQEFLQALPELGKCVALQEFPQRPVSGLSPDEQKIVQRELGDLPVSTEHQDRFGAILLHLAQTLSKNKQVDDDARGKLSRALARRAEFKSLPPGAVLIDSSIGGQVVIVRAKGAKDAEFRSSGGSHMDEVHSQTLRRLKLLDHHDARLDIAKQLTAHERMTALAISKTVRSECPMLASGPTD